MRLVLMDGTEIDGGQAGYNNGFLWLTFRGMTLQEAAAIFFDPSKTGLIVFYYGEMSDRYEGFTNCTAFNLDSDGVISVCLEKGAAE